MSDWTEADEIGTTPKAKPRSPWQRFKDFALEGALHSPLGAEPLARAYLKHIKGYTDEEINQGERNLSDKLAAKNAADPVLNTDDDEWITPVEAGKAGVSLAGGLIGGVDPTVIFAPGKNVAQRILAQSGINAGVDALGQVIEKKRGVRDNYDPWQTGLNAAAGVVTQGGAELARGAKASRNLIDTILHLEGGGTLKNPKTSPAGAKGPMQVMDATARDPGFGIRPWNGKSEADRARVGRELAFALNKKYKGDTTKVLAAYNAGHGRVDKLVRKYGDDWASHLPGETKKYIRNGLGRIGGKTVDPRLEDDAEDLANLPEDRIMRVDEEDMAALEDTPEVRQEDPEIFDDNVVEFPTYEKDRQLFADAVNNPRTDVDDPLVHLTNAERQEMDASVRPEDRPAPLDNYHEKFTPYVEHPPRAANNEDRIDELDDLIQNAKTPEERDAYAREQDALMAKESEAEHEAAARSKAVHGNKPLNDQEASWRRVLDTENKYADFAFKRDDPRADLDMRHKARKEYEAELAALEQAKKDAAKAHFDKYKGELDKPKSFSKTFFDMMKDDEGSYRDPADVEDGREFPDVVKKLSAAIKAAKRLPAEQRRLYRAERKERLAKLAQAQKHTSGEAGYYAELSKLKGELPKADFEGIRENFTQKEIDELFDHIKNFPKFDLWDQVNARNGLLKLFGVHGGQVPTDSELQLLSKVFPEDMISELMKNRELRKRIGRYISNALNIPRALMSSLDFSAPLRQGVTMVSRKQFYSSFFNMFKLFGSQKAYDGLMDEITSRPTYRLMKEAHLGLTDIGKFLDKREEDFMTDWAEKIPLLGLGVKASSRAYTGFLNKLRADVFDDLIRNGADLGIDWKKDTKALKDLGRYINASSGRGNLGKFNQAAPLLNSVFFSPRLMASRLTMMNPAFYVSLHPLARKEAARDLLTFAGVAMTTLGLAKMMLPDVEIEADPRSADFAKIKVGNTRYDILGGYQQYIRLAAQMLTNETKTTKGDVKKLGNPKDVLTGSRWDVFMRFMRSKFSPVTSYVVDYADNKNVIGEEFDVKKDTMNRFIPFLFQALNDSIQEHGIAKGTAMQVPGVFGVGVQTYDSNKKLNSQAKAKEAEKQSSEWGDDDEFADAPKETKDEWDF